MKNIGLVIIAFLLGILLISSATFTVDQREYALVKRLGEVVAVKKNLLGSTSRCLLLITWFILISVF